MSRIDEALKQAGLKPQAARAVEEAPRPLDMFPTVTERRPEPVPVPDSMEAPVPAAPVPVPVSEICAVHPPTRVAVSSKVSSAVPFNLTLPSLPILIRSAVRNKHPSRPIERRNADFVARIEHRRWFEGLDLTAYERAAHG